MRQHENGYRRMGQRNIGFGFSYLLEASKHPEILKVIPQGAHIIFIPSRDRWLQDKNLKLAKSIVAEGEKVVLLPVRANT